MSEERIAIAKAIFECYVSKSRAALEKLIAEDFRFTSPLDNGLDRATYFERCWQNSETTERFDYIHVSAQGDLVFVAYEGHGVGGRVFRNTEILTIHDGQAHAVEVYFGWSLPHPAKPGGFVDAPDAQHR
jgi:hypothetical protein